MSENGYHLFDNRPRDYNIAYQMHKCNDHAFERMKGEAIFKPVTNTALMDLILSQKGVCALTGESTHLVFDHIMPLALEGNHDVSNLRAVSRNANYAQEAIILRYWDSLGLTYADTWVNRPPVPDHILNANALELEPLPF
jgi:hypothetical protein